MHQDMKNFLEATAIDTTDKLQVDIALEKIGNIDFKFTVNDREVGPGTTLLRFDLRDSLNFKCQVTDFTEGSSGVSITNLSVNGREVLPKYQHRAVPATAYIDWIGDWQLTIPGPFYSWYQELTGHGWTISRTT
jgi:hypothetical protein